MVRVRMTWDIAWAAATDAGNLSAKLAGRKVWNEDDYAVASSILSRLWPVEREIRDRV